MVFYFFSNWVLLFDYPSSGFIFPEKSEPLRDHCITRKWLTVCTIGVEEITFGQECKHTSDHKWHKITIKNIYATIARLWVNMMYCNQRSLVLKYPLKASSF
jgi:hypothetical protein